MALKSGYIMDADYRIHLIYKFFRNYKLVLLSIMLILFVNYGFAQVDTPKDTALINVIHEVQKIKSDLDAVKKWQVNQKEVSDLYNQRINDNLSQSDRLFAFTSIGISIFAFIITVMNIVLFVWIFLVQRNLKQETKEINADTKKSRMELDEKLTKKSEDLNRKTEELYKKMLDSKYGQYDKKLRDEIVNEDVYQEFEQLDSFSKKVLRADKELDENNTRAAITHFTQLLGENKVRDYIYNRIGIAYYKIGANMKAAEYFEKAYNETDVNKKKYILNLLSQYMILKNYKKVLKMMKTCETIGIDKESIPVFFTLKFIYYMKINDLENLNLLKEEQKKIDWNQKSSWEFHSFKDCFVPELANDFSEIFRFSNIQYSPN